MKTPVLLPLLAASLLATPALAGGDPVVGKQKATACVACHGSENFAGVFYTLQLGGRNADKLTIKTNKYKSGKILHPVMNLATAFFTEQEIEDISAYYQSLGKPAFISPLFTIKGDDDGAETTTKPLAGPMPAATPSVSPETADRVATRY